MKYSLNNTVIIFSAFFLLSACATDSPKPQASLYDRLGGKKAIDLVVNDFIDTVGNDQRIQNPKVSERMANIDIDRLKGLVADQVCMAAGGPCEYKGRDMISTHLGLDITNVEFDYVVDDLVKTLDKYKVPEREKQELLALLAPMRADIVQAP
jgi:hemoglobin